MSKSRLEKLEVLMEEAHQKKDIYLMLVLHDAIKKVKPTRCAKFEKS